MGAKDAGSMLAVQGEALQAAREILGPWASQAVQPESNRLDISLEAADLAAAVAALSEGRWGVLAAITGLDLGDTGLEVLYHFCAGPAVVTLRVRAPRDSASVPTVRELIPAAALFERELSEMFGVTLAGSADSERLYLPDDWPEGHYPLRKDFALPALAGQTSDAENAGRGLRD